MELASWVAMVRDLELVNGERIEIAENGDNFQAHTSKFQSPSNLAFLAI